jgi:hypothetical protein
MFHLFLSQMPGRGDVASYHCALCKIARTGKLAGLPPEEVRSHIINRTIETGRNANEKLSDIDRTIAMVFQSKAIPNRANRPGVGAPEAPQNIPSSFDLFCRIAAHGAGIGGADLLEASNPSSDGPVEADAHLFLRTLFEPDDLICLAEHPGKTEVRPRDAWLEDIQKYGNRYAFFCINPLSRKEILPGKRSRRCDEAVTSYRYFLVEFDPSPDSGQPSVERQIEFWAVYPFPVKSLVFSGGKSIHAIIDLDGMVTNQAEWDDFVRGEIYRKRLCLLGADPSNANPSRLSRFPGHLRGDTGQWQRLIYLAEEPKFEGIFPEAKKTLRIPSRATE